MAHFAEIDANGVVTRVIVIGNDVASDPAPDNSEPAGKAFIENNLGLSGTFIQTSYHARFRNKFAGVGDKYLADLDAFVSPQPFPSWILGENLHWLPPVAHPDDGGFYNWDEEALTWIPLYETNPVVL
jgi:hypothetical protein